MLIIKIGDQIIDSYMIFQWNSVGEKRKKKNGGHYFAHLCNIKIKENIDNINLLLYSVIMIKKWKTDDINLIIYFVGDTKTVVFLRSHLELPILEQLRSWLFGWSEPGAWAAFYKAAPAPSFSQAKKNSHFLVLHTNSEQFIKIH